jgi:acyl carrier protein
VTEESFTADGWFMTGDLALIDDDGFLHMLGRHKDDINVNGVKHPSMDVEHFIDDSNIAGVENSFVYVSAMRLEGAATETYAVFYRHANVDVEKITEDGLADDEAKEILATIRSIKNACSAFFSQAPHVILPLPRHYFIKTALGKVSRSALAKAYEQGKFGFIECFLADAAAAQESGSTSAAPRSAIDEVICEGVALVFDLDPTTLELDQNLFDIGASSMHLIQLKQFLQDRFHIQDIPTIEMLKRPVISELSSYIQETRDPIHGTSVGDNSSYNPLVCFNNRGTKPPLYLVHPGVGEVLIFSNLARVLNDDRPVYALRARGFEAGETPPTSMQEMVDIYTASIVANNPTGPYFIAGYSFGGAVAVEIAKSLERLGKTVAWVGIMNLPPFIQSRIRELIWVETV